MSPRRRPTCPRSSAAREVREIADLVAPGRLVTLLGPGGCGKTRLAARVARGVRGDMWPDGARWVALEGEGDADAVAARTARQLDVLLPAGADPLTGLVEVLRDRTAVLVLDPEGSGHDLIGTDCPDERLAVKEFFAS